MTNYQPVSTTNITVYTNIIKQPNRPSLHFYDFVGIQNNAAVDNCTLTWTLDRPFFIKSIDANHMISAPLTVALYTQVRVTFMPPNSGSTTVYMEQQMEGVIDWGVSPTLQPVQYNNWKKVYPNLLLDTGTQITVYFVVKPANIQNAQSWDRTNVVIEGYYLPGAANE